MSAEQLIALEAAVSELGDLYTVARGFVPLRAAAEAEFLPRLLELGSRLRRLVRDERLTDNEVDHAAREIIALRSAWESKLRHLYRSSLFRKIRQAVEENRQQVLPELLPGILAGLRALEPTPSLYFPVSVSSGRRRPGTAPFVAVEELAETITSMVGEGLRSESRKQAGSDDLPSIACAIDPQTLDTPVCLLLSAEEARIAPIHVFEHEESFAHLIFARHVRAPMSVVLAANATDEWWDTNEQPYPEFRDALAAELKKRGQAVAVSGD